jgi:hypothetical protein
VDGLVRVRWPGCTIRFARAGSRVASHRVGSVAGVGRPRVYQEERVVRAVRLPASTDAELRALAQARGCTINQLVADALEGLVQSAPPVEEAG